jgi:crotonobetainyl-CoA:carnitine CoA-transferase CaiB-like acyl-CoA transferase
MKVPSTRKTATTQIALAVLTEAHWARFCEFIGRPELTNHSDYRIAPMRVENRDSLNREIQPVLATKPADYWVAEFNRLGLACCHVNDVVGLVDHPQLRHRNFFQDWVIDGHKVRAPGAPWNPAGPGDRDRLPPAIGEHTEAILSDWLTLSPRRIAELRAAKVVEGPAAKA